MWSEHRSYQIRRGKHLAHCLQRRRATWSAGREKGVRSTSATVGGCLQNRETQSPSYVEPIPGAGDWRTAEFCATSYDGARPIASMTRSSSAQLDHPRTRVFARRRGPVGIGGTVMWSGFPRSAVTLCSTTGIMATSSSTPFRLASKNDGGSAGAAVAGRGNPVLNVGSATGRDGIQGASLAGFGRVRGESE